MFISRHLIATLGGDNDTVNKNSNDRMNSCCSRKVFGIPTVFVGDEMFFGKERMGQIAEEILSQQAAASQ